MSAPCNSEAPKPGGTAPPSADTRKEVLELLKDLQSHYGTYHNHKENMSWAGVVLYIVLMACVANTIAPLELKAFARMTASALVIYVCGICTLYVRCQFQLRARAADLFLACVRLRSALLSTPERAIKPSDWRPASLSSPDGLQSTAVLPLIIFDTASELARVGQRPRRQLERCAYALLLGPAIALLVRFWVA